MIRCPVAASYLPAVVVHVLPLKATPQDQKSPFGLFEQAVLSPAPYQRCDVESSMTRFVQIGQAIRLPKSRSTNHPQKCVQPCCLCELNKIAVQQHSMQSWRNGEAADVPYMTMSYPMVTAPSGQGPKAQCSTTGWPGSAGTQQWQLNKGSPADFLLAGMPAVPYQSDKFDDSALLCMHSWSQEFCHSTCVHDCPDLCCCCRHPSVLLLLLRYHVRRYMDCGACCSNPVCTLLHLWSCTSCHFLLSCTSFACTTSHAPPLAVQRIAHPFHCAATSLLHSTQPESTAWNGPGFSRRLSAALPRGPAGRRSISSPNSQRTETYIGSTFYQQSTQREREQQNGHQGHQQRQQLQQAQAQAAQAARPRSAQGATEPLAVGLSDVYGLAQGKSAADLDELLLSDMLAEDDMSGAPVETGVGPGPAASSLLKHESLSQLLSEKEDKSAKEERDAADDVAADDMTEDAEWKPGNLSGEEQPISGRKRRHGGGRSGGRAPNEDNRRSRRCAALSARDTRVSRPCSESANLFTGSCSGCACWKRLLQKTTNSRLC